MTTNVYDDEERAPTLFSVFLRAVLIANSVPPRKAKAAR